MQTAKNRKAFKIKNDLIQYSKTWCVHSIKMY